MADPAAPPQPAAFQSLQRAFAAHLRDPAQHPAPPGIEDRRMAVYRDLFFNSIESLLATQFPVLRAISPDADWQARVRRFYAGHRCRSPYFLELAEEFLHWLSDEGGMRPEDPPFLAELAHYEWVELALSIAPDEAPAVLAATDPTGDLLDGVPVVSSLAWPLAYRFPVHGIGPEHQPSAPGGEPTCLVVYRDAADEVRFLEINPVTYRLLQRLDEPEAADTGRAQLAAVAAELQHPQPEAVLAHGAALLADLRARGILLGVRS